MEISENRWAVSHKPAITGTAHIRYIVASYLFPTSRSQKPWLLDNSENLEAMTATVVSILRPSFCKLWMQHLDVQTPRPPLEL